MAEQPPQHSPPAGSLPPAAPATATPAVGQSAVGSGIMDWPTDHVSYDLIQKIGHGAFATVWKARTRNSEGTSHASTTTATTTAGAAVGTVEAVPPVDHRRECAVKVLNLDHVDTNLAEIRLEVQAMRLSSHPNILTCHTAFVHDVHLWLVTPLMKKGSSLHCMLHARAELRRRQLDGLGTFTSKTTKKSPLQTEAHILYILRETLLGLQYIHENGQIHRDIKASNILLDGDGDVKIADFGVSGWLIHAGSQQLKAQTFVGTPCWMAPEVMEQVHGYNATADVWSLGITALELAMGYAPYAKYPPMKVLILTIQEDPPTLESYDDEDDAVGGEDSDLSLMGGRAPPEVFSKAFSSLVDQCLQKNPSRRPSCQDLLQQNKLLAVMNDPATRAARRDAMKKEICDLVADVGSLTSDDADSNTTNNRASMPGNSPVSFILNASQEQDRPAGTTWVFADGSQILSSDAAKAATVDDVMAEMDAFGEETGGEHYDRTVARSPTLAEEATAALAATSIGGASGSASASPPTNHDAGFAEQTNTSRSSTTTTNIAREDIIPPEDFKPDADNEEDDTSDIDAFMDEFEMNTVGEDFRRA